jgi:hypothetical protein
MTTAADDRALEDAFQAYLAGRPVPDEGAALASFAGAVRTTATRPGRPNAALAELLATGLLADQPSPSTRTARSAGAPPSRGTRIRNRRRFAMFFPALLAKFLSAGAVAQATAGAGAVVVVVTGAGVVGVLPDPVQDTVATAIGTVTPFELPEGEETEPVEAPVAEKPTDEAPTGTVVVEAPADDVAFDAEVWEEQGPDAYPSFGAWVSAGTHHDVVEQLGARNFGELVSARARAKGMSTEDLAAEGVDVAALEIDDADLGAPADSTTAPQIATERPTTVAPTAPAPRGNGNGNGRGNGGPAGAGGTNGNADAAKGNGRN